MKKQLTLLLLLTFSLLKAQVPAAERNALIDFYNSLSGSGWYNGANANWTTAQPVNTWSGVTTEVISGTEHVTKIFFYNKNLNGILPTSIGNLSELKELILIKNRNLTGAIPTELGNCLHLTKLILQENRLSGGIPVQLGNLTQLVDLNLSKNQLSGGIPTQLGNLNSLLYLNLYSNGLSGAIPTELGNLSALIVLYIYDNNLSGGIPTQLNNLTVLEYLGLSDNQLSGIIPDLSALTLLKRMYIRNNNFHFSDIEPQYTALQTVCQANGGDYYYIPMNNLNTEDVIDMVVGNNYTFTMSAINGTGVTYQWYQNGVEITGATTNTYTITNAQNSDLGDYMCKALSPVITDLTIDRKVIHLYGTINATDKAALLALYNATDGSNWTNHTNWNTIQPVYTWFGIKMQGDRVTEINLQNNGLNGNLPVEIGNLNKLQVLNINNMMGFYTGRMLSGALPTELGNLTELRMLILNYHSFTGTIPSSIGNCTALTDLEFWHNQLTGGIPTSLGNLINLEVITLEENQLTGVIPASFANCTKMESFWLNDNQLSGDVPDIFGVMPALYYVSLSRNSNLSGEVILASNPAVYGVWLDNLQISSIDIRNGVNTIMRTGYFNARNNPNLTCIFVDDATYCTTNWTNIDATSHFVENQAQCDAYYTYVPDNNFEQALIDLGYDDRLDDYVVTSHIDNIYNLVVSNKNITDLTGIEDFVGTHMLQCFDNNITTLDISNNINLEKLYCYNNNLTLLNTTSNVNLIHIFCSYNNISSLDLSTNTNLQRLACNDNNFTSLNLSANTQLESLGCSNNNISSLDLSNNTQLDRLYCYNTNISSLDLSNQSLLDVLWVDNNNLSFLDLRNGANSLLTGTFGNGSNIYERLKLQNNPNLTCIFVDDATYCTTNWTNIDATSHFVENQAQCDALSVDNYLQSSISVYPNPTSGMISINTNSDVNIDKMIVTNLTGQVIKTLPFSNSVDISDFPSGMYIIKIIGTDKSTAIFKIIKE